MCGAQLTTKSSNVLLGLKLVKLPRLTINHDYTQGRKCNSERTINHIKNIVHHLFLKHESLERV